MKENKKLTIAILVVVLTIFLISGGTLAYWQWMTSADQNTLVNASPIDEASMYIDFPSYESKGLYPTSDCNLNATSSWVTEVTVDNDTGVMVAPRFRLKVKIVDKDGNIITNADTANNKDEENNPLKYRHFIKYVVTEEYGECNKPLATGRFETVEQVGTVAEGWYDSDWITITGSDNFPDVSSRIGSGVSFHAGPNKETTHKYKVWVWMDKEYTYTSQGTESSDPFQDAKITVSWSENSTLEQVRVGTPTGNAYAVYSADDNSLRFYRSVTEIEEGKPYNGRIATEVYTEFDYVPWEELASDITTVVFEDYIYPTSTAGWFRDFSNLTTLDLTKLDTSNVTDMSHMFYDVNLNSLDLSHFDTSNVISMMGMFHDASILNLDITGWDTANVTYMSSMFSDFEGNILGIEDFNTSNVTDMQAMFYYASVSTLDLSGWNVCNIAEGYSFEFSSGTTISEPYFDDVSRCNGGLPA